MSVRLSQAFFSELGLQTWQARPGYFSHRSTASPAEQLETELTDLPQQSADTMIPSKTETIVKESRETMDSQVEPSRVLPWVWVGDGLASIWQNPQSPEWQLTLNILRAFKRSPDQLVFIDAANCQSDEAIMDVLDQVIALGVEQVFVFERHSPLIEELQEGAELIDLPRFDQLMSSAQAKQTLYEILCQVSGRS